MVDFNWWHMRIGVFRHLIGIVILLVLFVYFCYSPIIAQYNIMRLQFIGVKVSRGRKDGPRFFIKMPSHDARHILQTSLGHIATLSNHGEVELDLSGSDLQNADLAYLLVIDGPLHIDITNTAIDRGCLDLIINMKHLFGIRADPSQISSSELQAFWHKRSYLLD